MLSESMWCRWGSDPNTIRDQGRRSAPCWRAMGWLRGNTC